MIPPDISKVLFLSLSLRLQVGDWYGFWLLHGLLKKILWHFEGRLLLIIMLLLTVPSLGGFVIVLFFRQSPFGVSHFDSSLVVGAALMCRP